MSKEIIPIGRRVLAFWLPARGRVKVNGLYVADKYRNKGTLSSAQEIWVISSAKDCKLGPWTRGAKYYVHDGFELWDGDLGLWDSLKDYPEFYDLKCYAENLEATVGTTVVSEGSILAIADHEF